MKRARPSARMTNRVDGLVSGLVVQAGVIKGGVHLHQGNPRADGDPEALAARLADAVSLLWAHELAVRGLNNPYPLPVDLRLADAELFPAWTTLVRLATGDGRRRSRSNNAWANSPRELVEGEHMLATVFPKVPSGRLVVLGDAGSGKTTLGVRFMLDLLAERRAGDPVPVMVTAAGWAPERESLAEWLRQSLYRAHPFLGVKTVEGKTRFDVLLAAGLLLPIVDGLDEMAERLRPDTIRSMNQFLQAPGQRIVVTCRTEEFRAACRPGDREVTLVASAGVELCPLEPGEVADYLESSSEGPARAGQWGPVRKALQEFPEVPVVQALRTPLLASMARELYNPAAGDLDAALPDPASLLAFPDVAAVEEHLFDAYVQHAYRGLDGERAERWLINLAHFQQTTLNGSPDIEWWRFDQAIPHALRAGLGAFVGGINVGLLGDSQSPARGLAWSWQAFLRRFTQLIGFWVTIAAVVYLGGDHTTAYACMAIGLAVGVVSGVVVGTSGDPVELPSAVSPTGVLAIDREVFLVSGAGLAVLAGGLFGTVGFFFGATAGMVVGSLGAFYAGAAVAMGKAAWGWFGYARLWWFLGRRMPLRSIRFLTDAHRRGVLRQAGAAWQFRHLGLQRRLAARHPAYVDVNRSA
ncbi:NACHT domain-containing protein [Amycolatopsis alba]|nr:NACHT domain-containing protein [Amycolatopsis alba]